MRSLSLAGFLRSIFARDVLVWSGKVASSGSASGLFVMSSMDLDTAVRGKRQGVCASWRVDRYNLVVWLTRKIPAS
jgi:hypothetical protein